MNASEKSFQDEKDARLLEWRNKLASVENFLSERKEKFEDDDGSDADLETVAKQRREMEVFDLILLVNKVYSKSYNIFSVGYA